MLEILWLIDSNKSLFVQGWVDYIGSSHQWWHVLVVAALYYWHNTGLMYVEFRLNNGCPGLSQLWHEAHDDASCKYTVH